MLTLAVLLLTITPNRVGFAGTYGVEASATSAAAAVATASRRLRRPSCCRLLGAGHCCTLLDMLAGGAVGRLVLVLGLAATTQRGLAAAHACAIAAAPRCPALVQ